MSDDEVIAPGLEKLLKVYRQPEDQECALHSIEL